MQFFGRYIGTVRRSGFWWVAPLTVRRRVSIRVRNFETNHLKVNDADGNPVEIAAIVVWQVADTAKSSYAVDNFVDFISVQAESALRHVAVSHPYDDTTGTGHVAARLHRHRGRRAGGRGGRARRHRGARDRRGAHLPPGLRPGDRAGDAAPSAGQRRRVRRSRIVEGAVGMVEMALSRLNEGGVVSLDEERTASMVSNLMVVLCGDQPPSPVVNTGSLYT